MTQWNTKTWRSGKRTWAVCHVSLLPCQHRNFSKGHHILTSNSGWIWADFELETSGILLYWFPRAVVTSYHNLDGLQLQECIISQFWKQQVQPLGVGNSESPWRARLFCLCQLPAFLDAPLLSTASFQPLPRSMVFAVFVWSLPLILTYGHSW